MELTPDLRADYKSQVPKPPALTCAAVLLLCSCATPGPTPKTAALEKQVFQLLADTPERETQQILERRTDVEVDTRDFDRTPHVVATGETPVFRLEGGHARLFGDKAGSAGWSVDNFVLIEVLDPQGHRINSAAIGFTDGVMVGSERVDSLGRLSFSFDAGEVDLTSHLPEREPFRIRATALDYNGVGKVSDVFVVVSSGPRKPGPEEELSAP